LAKAWRGTKRRLSITVLAARKGNVFARYNLGIREMKLKHAIWRGILNTS